VRHELQLLIDDLDEVFEVMREAFRAKESAAERTQTAAERTADGIAALVSSQAESNRLVKKGLRRCAELAVAKGAEEADDAYSSLAGLEGLSAAKRQELQACFRYSHEHFAVERGDKTGKHSLGRLAEIVWRDHATEFAALVRLSSAAGYKDARSLAAKLYKLAARYPAADHFRWRT